MYQSWNWLTFLHWAYEPAVIQPLLPAGLTVDEYDGVAWVGLVPFQVDNLRLPNMRAIPWISSFPETNVRTYVRDPNGDRGIWFLSLDADRLAAVVGARTGFRLNYQWAQMKLICEGASVRYTSSRNGLMSAHPAHSEIEVEVGEPISPFVAVELQLVHRSAAAVPVDELPDHQLWFTPVPLCMLLEMVPSNISAQLLPSRATAVPVVRLYQ